MNRFLVITLTSLMVLVSCRGQSPYYYGVSNHPFLQLPRQMTQSFPPNINPLGFPVDINSSGAFGLTAGIRRRRQAISESRLPGGAHLGLRGQYEGLGLFGPQDFQSKGFGSFGLGTIGNWPRFLAQGVTKK